MASQFTIAQVISFAQISLYLAANDQAAGSVLKSGSIITTQPSLLYIEGELLKSMYALNPNGSTIRKTAEYVLSLCGKYLSQAQTILNNLAASPPVITGPANQTVNVGGNAVFSISVVSSLPYTVQWFDSMGNPIVGETGLTYTFPNAQQSDSGKTFYAKATNGAGTTTSAIGVLTVTQNILLYAAYMDLDPHGNLISGIDDFIYQYSVNVTHNNPINIPIPQVASNNKYWVWRIVSTEQDNNTWFNTGLNSGQIPDFVFYPVIIFGGNDYYSLKNATSFDYTVPLILSKV